MNRRLYLVCYDVASPKRLRRVHKMVSAYAVCGQKSSYECWMTKPEMHRLKTGLRQTIDAREDRVHVFELDPRQRVFCFGTAQRPSVQPFMIV